MIANVQIFLNDTYVSAHDVIMNEGDTVDTQAVIDQINEVFGPDSWNKLEVVSIS